MPDTIVMAGCGHVVIQTDPLDSPPVRCFDCWRSRHGADEPQGEPMRLFQPAPNQLPGQLGF